MRRYLTVSDTIKGEMAKPYAYGKSDCFFLALAAVDALKDSKLQKEYSGIYTTFSGAQRAMKKRGFISIGDLFAKHLEAIAPADAALGDVVVLEVAGKEHSAICIGENFFTRIETGQSVHPLSDVKSAFRV